MVKCFAAVIGLVDHGAGFSRARSRAADYQGASVVVCGRTREMSRSDNCHEMASYSQLCPLPQLRSGLVSEAKYVVAQLIRDRLGV